MDNDIKKKLDQRLARAEGQIRGLRRMVDEDAYCIDVLTQLGAVRSALDQLGAEIAASHVKTCIIGDSSDSKMSQDEKIEELRNTLSRLMK
jgi:DNA-binding FrmR family transcriptional regulator